ncbi:MAG: DNA primase, partial [Fimbriimonadaceae bacterium]|nr:DNA primase [Fimbriimonadaceae bacterium]
MGDEREEIRRRLNLVDLVSQRVSLQGPKQGKWKGLCPFHDDKNPSFEVNPSIGRYHCWACGEKGDIFSWVMKTRNVEFREALEILAREAGVELEAYKGPTRSERLALEDAMEHAKRFFEAELKRSEAARKYCADRGLDESTLSAWEIGYAPDVGDALAGSLRKEKFELRRCKELFLVEEDASGGYYDKFRGRLMFPIRDEHGKLVAFGGRVLGDGHPKYINSSDTPLYRKSHVLYGMHRAKAAIAKEQQAVLVEGYLDVIACHRAGLETAVASLGTALATEQAKLLGRWCRQAVILYDADEAGKKAADRAADILQEAGLEVRIALMPPGEDPDTLLRTQGAAAVVAAAKGGLKPLAHRIGQLVARSDPHEEAFWSEAFSILAAWRSPLELDEMVVRLAPLYPHTKDPTINQKSIRTGVNEARRQRARDAGRTP